MRLSDPPWGACRASWQQHCTPREWEGREEGEEGGRDKRKERLGVQ